MDRSGKAVVVCTDKRGVFFGYASGPTDGPDVTLMACRMCVYWHQSTKGVLGLAATGPGAGSKITDAVQSALLHGVTCVLEASPESVTEWESGKWS